ncbi:unnamed protein product [Dicrocoelium dendriticum]|nr:unnamed protein product [Dicrocoelium dendriticum]
MGNTLIICDSDIDVSILLNRVNSVHPSLKFTSEIENDGRQFTIKTCVPESNLSCCETEAGRKAACCQGPIINDTHEPCPCKTTCWSVVEQKLERGIRVIGTIGLFFSVVELMGVWLALQYRHKRDPSVDPYRVL